MSDITSLLPPLSQLASAPVRTQVLLCVHIDGRSLGHPRALPERMEAHEDYGMAGPEDYIPLPPRLHARRVHHRW